MSEDLFSPEDKERLLAVLREKKPKHAWLFGSRAKETAGPDSDVDLLIVDERAGGNQGIELDISRELFPRNWHLDILGYSPAQMRQELEKGKIFLASILEEGKLLYGQSML